MAKTVDLRTYVLIERAFVRRLQRSWATYSAPTYAAIAAACIAGKHDEARRLVGDLDMTEIGIENREWISYMLLSCAVFGAGIVAKNKPSFVGVGTFDTLLKQTTANFLQYLEFGATQAVQAEALQLIAEDETKSKAVKAEHKYGNTQIEVDPKSSAAASLNAARSAIKDADTMADGKDVDPNHVTVRYGLTDEDHDRLRQFIAERSPFEAQVLRTELFPASEHSDGAVPVVARIGSPELRAIEEEIGKYAAFKEKSFPVYKPHCTLAYCKPEAAKKYADLYVDGSFIVRGITISHTTGVQETIPFGAVRKWGKGNPWHAKSGLFTSKDKAGKALTEYSSSPKHALEEILDGDKVNIDRHDVREFLERAQKHAAKKGEEANLTHLHVEGMKIFGGDGLGIPRGDMPQIPREHRKQFLQELEDSGIKIVEETVDPLTLKPTQKEISAASVAEKLARYDKGGKEFPPLLVSKQDHILDGHHHWGMMATVAIDAPKVRVPIYRLMISTKQALALMHAYDKEHGIERKALGQKADKTGRYVTPFVDFSEVGNAQLQLIASLNASRLATWGFTAEAEVLGYARYRVTAVLDGRTSQFCRMVDGKIFNVQDAREKVIEALNVQNPDDLRVVQPWPKQNKAAMAEYSKMSPKELTDRGLHIPPYHPGCRTLLKPIEGSKGTTTAVTPTVPAQAEVFQAVTAQDLAEIGVIATPEQVAEWNAHVGMSPVELMTKLAGLRPQDVMTKGVGPRPVTFQPDGLIALQAKGVSQDVSFKLGLILDPFTGTYYLTQAALEAGTPKAEALFLKRMFNAVIDMGLKSTATSVAVNVAGNAPYYAKLGFLPDELEWSAMRKSALVELEVGSLHDVMLSLAEEDQLLVRHLLQDRSVTSLSALVDLPFMYQGRTIGEWILRETTGTFALDLTDAAIVAQAKEYLS